MIRLAHRVRVKAVRLGGPVDATLWAFRCPGCDQWSGAPIWRFTQILALDHATHCPELRRLNRPVTLGRPS